MNEMSGKMSRGHWKRVCWGQEEVGANVTTKNQQETRDSSVYSPKRSRSSQISWTLVFRDASIRLTRLEG